MKNRHTRLSLLIVVLAVTAQLSIFSTPAQAQGLNFQPAAVAHTQMGIPYNRRCRRRCERAYRWCVRSGKNVRSCRVRLRNCLRRCPQ